jgi:hypothetical protein
MAGLNTIIPTLGLYLTGNHHRPHHPPAATRLPPALAAATGGLTQAQPPTSLPRPARPARERHESTAETTTTPGPTLVFYEAGGPWPLKARLLAHDQRFLSRITRNILPASRPRKTEGTQGIGTTNTMMGPMGPIFVPHPPGGHDHARRGGLPAGPGSGLISAPASSARRRRQMAYRRP